MAWVEKHQAYVDACRRIAAQLEADPKTPFKCDPDYAGVVGNDTRNLEVTQAFLGWHLARGVTPQALHKRVAANDSLGQPRLHSVGGFRWSAGSLRFAQVAEEMNGAPAVIEVGGGYGGQRALAAGVPAYAIVDLPEALALQRAYLRRFPGLRTTFHDPENLPEPPEGAFFLSDFALSELDRGTMKNYFTRLVVRCAAGRITTAPPKVDWFVSLLRVSFLRVDVGPEEPRTSPRHENAVIRFSGRTGYPAEQPDPQARKFDIAAIAQMLRDRVPFAFSRWGDGEWGCILGKGGANCDGQKYTEDLQRELVAVLEDRPDYYLGLQSLAKRRYGAEIEAWLAARRLHPEWTEADTFARASRRKRLDPLTEALGTRSVILIGPAHLAKLSLFPIAQHVVIPPRDSHEVAGQILAAALEAARPLQAPVFAISAGLTANLLVHRLHEALPGATAIDFGSLWEPYVGMATRSYHRDMLEGRE